jgi:hypothetical protein
MGSAHNEDPGIDALRTDGGGIHNEGIQISGSGNLRARNLAVGRNARVTETHGSEAGPAEEVRKQVSVFLEKLAQHKNELPEHEDVAEAAKAVEAEAAKEKPNRLTLKSLMDGITTAVKSVSGMAVAAEALKTAVGMLLH